MSRQRIQSQASIESDRSYSEARSYGDSHYTLGWAQVIRFSAPTFGLLAVLGGLIALTLEAGCASKKTGLESSSADLSAASTSDAPQASALQVSPPPASTPAQVAPPQPPAIPDPVVTQAPTLAASTDPSVAAAGSTYTVQHGDTLFRIAKEHYGNGKQWTRIASANPGLSPANLKAGQKIVLP